MFNPVDLPLSVNGNDIKTYRRLDVVFHQVMACGRNYTGLFVPCNALQGTAKLFGLAKTDFHNDQRLAVLHDQIEFALLAAIIAGDRG